MTGFNKMTIKQKEFQYDLDPDIIFNYTSDHIQYLYTKESIEHEDTEEIETIYAANLIPTKDVILSNVETQSSHVLTCSFSFYSS